MSLTSLFVGTFASTSEAGPHISIAPEVVIQAGPVGITNAQVLGVVGSLLLLWLMFGVAKKVRSGGRSRLADGFMALLENLYDTAVEVIGDKKVARKILPLAITLFFFFLINNWIGLLPIVGPLTVDGIPLLRGAAGARQRSRLCSAAHTGRC